MSNRSAMSEEFSDDVDGFDETEGHAPERMASDGSGVSDDESVGEYDDDGLDDYFFSRPRGPRDFDPYERRRGDSDGIETTLPDEWRFLHKWFVHLRRADLTIEDPTRPHSDRIRLGRDPDDWWISVRLLPDHVHYEARKFYVKHYRTTREALLLTTILAQVDYDAWKKELDAVSNFKVPEKFGMPIRPLERKYSFSFSNDSTVNEYDWVKLKDIFGRNVLSKEFKADMQQVVHTAALAGLVVANMAPIPVCIRFCPSQGRYRSHAKGLFNIINTIRAMNDIAESNQRLQSSGSRNATLVFKLAEIDLDFRKADFHEEVLEALRHVLAMGIPIRSLPLPRFVFSVDPEDPELVQSWSLLMRVACGVNAKKPTLLRHLALTTDFNSVITRPCFFAATCSALAKAHGLESVRIDAAKTHGFGAASNEWMCTWLSFALFSSQSSGSIKKVAIDAVELNEPAMDRIQAVAKSSDPLGRLWDFVTGKVCHQEGGKGSSRIEVVVRKGSAVKLLGLEHSDYNVISLDDVYEGVVIVNDVKRPTLDVFLPGVGFGRINRDAVSNKRTRDAAEDSEGLALRARNISSSTVRLQSLELGLRATTWRMEEDGLAPGIAESYRKQLLRLFNSLDLSGLSSLRLKSPGLNGKCLADCVRLCPKLQSLYVASRELSSLDEFAQLYANHGCIVSSLTLQIAAVPVDAFESFLRLMLTENAIKKRLKKLWVTSDPAIQMRQATADLIDQVLADVNTFDHFHLGRMMRSRYNETTRPLKWKTDRYHKQLLAAPLGIDQRVAFLSVARHLSESTKINGSISQDVSANIFDFAAPFVLERTVYIEDTDDRGYWW